MAILEGSIQHRRLSAAAWTTNNPVLLDGQIGIEIGTPDKVKIGDGATAWNSLGYSSGIPGASGNDGLSAYEIAVANGFVGDEAAWITSLQGSPGGNGLSAYGIAVANGFVGSVGSWIISLQGSPGAAGFASQFWLSSTTSNSIGTGIKTFTISSNNVGYSIGSRIRVFFDSANYMEGICTSVSGTSISINVTYTVGSGTYALWSLSVAGDRGATGANFVVLASDQTNNNAVANTMQDITGLSFPVVNGETYWFKIWIFYTAAIATTGGRFSVSASGAGTINYESRNSISSTNRYYNTSLGANDLPAASATSSGSAGNNVACIEGTFSATANGTVIARFASEVASSAIVAKAFHSHLQYMRLN